MSTNDFELVQQIQQGNYDAERRLFVRFGEKIDRIVRHKLGPNCPDLQDLVNDIQLAVLTSLRSGQFDLDRGVSLDSYIYGILQNKLREYRRRPHKPVVPIEGEKPVAANAEVESRVEREELQNTLRQLLERLDSKYKEVLYLRYYEGLKVGQIAERLGLPPRRVSERINYAIKLFRKECEKQNLLSTLRDSFSI